MMAFILFQGSQLLARHEDRIVWIQISEKGNNFCYYVAKGMELQVSQKVAQVLLS